MRFLNRTPIPAPACLAKYQHGTNTWDDVSVADKQEIRTSLELMQGRRCAYCEGSLNELDQHIEHFRRKSLSRHLTFAWENLYWSCDCSDSCGHHKDRGAGIYDINCIVDPCQDNPDRFFKFRSDGTIAIVSGLSPTDYHRATETLRVFNINPDWGRLRNMRKRALAGYIFLATEAQDFTAAELQVWFANELVASAGLPFCTAIRHILTAP